MANGVRHVFLSRTPTEIVKGVVVPVAVKMPGVGTMRRLLYKRGQNQAANHSQMYYAAVA
jgi:hypothetical protein